MRSGIEVGSEVMKASSGTASISRVPSATESMSAAVRKAFAQIGSLQRRTEDFNQATEQLEQLSKSVAKIFGPLRTIYSQMSEVIGSFDALCALKSEIASLSKSFEPTRLLYEQVSQLADSMQIELGTLVKSLAPVQQLNDKVNAFARTLRMVSQLHTDLADLHLIVRNHQGSKATPASGWSDQSAGAAQH